MLVAILDARMAKAQAIYWQSCSFAMEVIRCFLFLSDTSAAQEMKYSCV